MSSVDADHVTVGTLNTSVCRPNLPSKGGFAMKIKDGFKNVFYHKRVFYYSYRELKGEIRCKMDLGYV